MLFAASSETNCSIFGSRLEKLNWRSNSSLAKCLGTIVSITGAFVVTFYKGPPILMTLTSPIHPLLSSPQLNWIFGGLLLVAEALMISAWYIAQVRFISILLKPRPKNSIISLFFPQKSLEFLQALVLKKFPAILIIMFYLTFFSAIQSGVYSLAMVKEPSAWKLRLDIGLFAVLYSVST